MPLVLGLVFPGISVSSSFEGKLFEGASFEGKLFEGAHALGGIDETPPET